MAIILPNMFKKTLLLSIVSLNLFSVGNTLNTAAPDAGADTSANGLSWNSAISKAKAIVSQLTLDEMNQMLFTYTPPKGTSCSLTHGAPQFGFPGFCLNDGPAGVRAVDLTNAYPAGLSVAAGWNTQLAYERATYMGQEFRAKGVQVAFAPVVAPLGRIAKGGRNWEGFGADPYPSGQLGAASVEGLQNSIIATVKHFIGYEQENGRSPFGTPNSYSSNIDDQTLHELYMWPFQDTVRANVGCVMCSYNRLNSTYACENSHVLTQLLKTELAFPGFVVSDQLAQHSGIESAAAGLDVSLGSPQYWDHGKLAKAVQDGKLPKSRLEDMATRILASWFKVINGPNNSSFPKPGYGIPFNILQPHRLVDARSPASKSTILQSATEGQVLVKNVNNTLPLQKPVLLSLYGYDALIAKVNYATQSSMSKWVFGLDADSISTANYTLAIAGYGVQNPPQSAALGTLITGGGSGAGTPSLIYDAYSAILQQADADGTYLSWDFSSLNPSVNPESTACLVFVNDVAAEGYDRVGLADPDSDKLIKNVASKCSNTIVVIHNNGIRVVDAWINNPNITAVLFAHTPGQATGQALVEVLYGSQSPSGRLPYTVPKKATDFGSILGPCALVPKNNPQCNFTERELIDYRRFLALDIEPQFAFGYGLTYTKFTYSNMAAQFLEANASTNPPNPDQTIPGGIKSLFDIIAEAKFKLTNSGNRSAAEVAQLYVQFPGDAKVRVLRGFSKIQLSPGDTASVQFNLTRRDLSRWNTKEQSWQLQSGSYVLYIGANVEDISLKTTLNR